MTDTDTFSTEAVIFAGVAVYVVLMIAIGIYAARRTHSSAEFILAGRNLSLGLCTATIIASWFGGSAMMGVAGAAYDEGMLGVIADPFGASISLLLVGLFFVRIFRRLKLYTFIEFVDQRFGAFPTLVTSSAVLMSNLAWVGAMLVAFGKVFETLTGTPVEIGIIGGALVVVLYTSMGGLLAVALTDFVQIVIIVIGLVILFGVVVADAGGWSNLVAQVPPAAWRLTPVEDDWANWMAWLRLWLIFGIADIASQTLLQRAMAARDERTAQNAFYLGGLGYFGFTMIPVLLGIFAAATMPGLADSEAVIPTLAIEHLHPIGVAIFVGAILAAIMSTADSALLASATIVSTNLLPFVRRNPSDHLSFEVTRWAIPVIGFICVFVALYARVIFDTLIAGNMLLLAAVIAPFILGVWWRKANRSGAVAAMSAGIGAWLVTAFAFPSLPGDLVGLAVSLVTMVVVTLATQASDPPRPVRDKEGNPVELSDRLGIIGFGKNADSA